MLTRGADALRLVFLASLSLGGCAATLDPKLTADTGHIRILDKPPPANCRYVGDAVSYQMVSPGLDVFNVREQQKQLHDAEVRAHAKSLGANAVYPHYIHNTGLFFVVNVNVFYGC